MLPFSVVTLGDVLLVSIQEEIDDTGISALFDTIVAKAGIRDVHGVILDLHKVEVVDSYLARHLQELAAGLKLMQTKVVVAGLCVPVVMTLLDFEIDLKGITFALDVEQAMAQLGTGVDTQMDA